MLTDWHYIKNGKLVGPVSESQFRELIAKSIICPDDLIWRPGFEKWRPAAEIEGMFLPPALPDGHDQTPPLPTSHQRERQPTKGNSDVVKPTVSVSEDGKKNGAKTSVGMNALQWLLVVVWMGVLKYYGWRFIIPALGAVISAGIATLLVKSECKPMIPAFGAQMGLGFYFAFAAFAAYKVSVDVVLYILLAEVCILIVGAIWIVSKPNLISISIVGLYQAVTISIGLHNVLSPDIAPGAVKSAPILLGLRALAILLMWLGLYWIRKGRSKTPASP
ncbi:MAG: DUF4339 domain-containing protein [Verrucomicrobia bacterium]|nr:DUF4339 domain-containing protein [Verrucomicrobiota bacterium]